MNITIKASQVEGSVTIPPSKSMAHRAIICACLAQGTSTLSNIDYSKDILATLDAMEALGAKIHRMEKSLKITGVNNQIQPQIHRIDCHESGSTLRFLIPLFSLSQQPISFTGSKRLMQRPQSLYQAIFDEQKKRFEQNENVIHVEGSISAQTFKLKGDVSSQFISGLLFALPLLKEDSKLEISEPFESRSYVDLTLETLHEFGVSAYYEDMNTLMIPGKQSYQSKDMSIEGDFSQMAFFAVLGALKGNLEVLGLNHDSKQGDKVILKLLETMGAKIEAIESGYRFFASNLKGTTIDLSDCPDLGPILCVAAACAEGETRIINAQRLRIKESDRIEAIETELRKFAINIHSTKDQIIIQGSSHQRCEEICESHNDHRIAMSLSILSLLLNQDIQLNGAQCVEKSYPRFYDDLNRLGVKVSKLYDAH